jgi:hypothetical protein
MMLDQSVQRFGMIWVEIARSFQGGQPRPFLAPLQESTPE